MRLVLTIFYLLLLSVHAIERFLWEPRVSLPGQCGPREYYSVCGSKCKANCYTVQVSIPCPSHECISGCYCQGGYLRSHNQGPCIREHRCKKTKGSNVKEQLQQLQQKEKELNKIFQELLKNSGESKN
ncbi:hypothetical protein ILUMI_24685 [Ignelater luminosus]|uniref:TIL domain-containing protein n=1 Tax=Ignelater luminosus TaxID=2038154 RepID=A0A8K0FYI5_IGNLU|nr:hypothetical protein ILUMI_24685 [Ignelater luminosus]